MLFLQEQLRLVYQKLGLFPNNTFVFHHNFIIYLKKIVKKGQKNNPHPSFNGGDLKKVDGNSYGRITKSTYAIEYKSFLASSLLLKIKKSSW